MYGGPGHGQWWPEDNFELTRVPPRVELVVQAQAPPCWHAEDPPYWHADVPIISPPYEQATYYVHKCVTKSVTEAGSVVRKELRILLLEGSDLFPSELSDMRRDLRSLPWKWERAPSILYEFDKWWEWQLHMNGIREVSVRYG